MPAAALSRRAALRCAGAAPCRAPSPRPRRWLSAEPEPELLIANAPGLRVVDLHRPQALNSINHSMTRTLLPLVQDWQQPQGGVEMVVLRGSGPRAFCAGGDIRYLYHCATAGEESALAAGRAFVHDEYTLNHALGSSRIPIVSLLEGIVMGGGVGLSVHGQVRVATESTLFAMPETGIGFFPDVGTTFVLPRLRGSLGMYLGLTGARLSGRDVLAAGVATHYVDLERLPMLVTPPTPTRYTPRCSALTGLAGAQEGILAELGKAASATGKPVDAAVLSNAIGSLGSIEQALSGEGAAAAEAPPSYLDVHADEIDHCFSQQGVAAITAAVEELAGAVHGRESAEAAAQHWAVRAQRGLALASPTSLAVTHEALRRGADLPSLAACLSMEYNMAQRFLLHPDLAAGIRAVLRLDGATGPAEWAEPPSEDELAEFFVPGAGGELVLE